MNKLNWAIIKHTETECHFGIILKSDDINTTYSRINKWSNSVSTFATDKLEILPLSEASNCLEDIQNYYNDEIGKLNCQIKSLDKANYAGEMIETYLKLKNQILATAMHMIKSDDDIEFENKLKAICDLKKQLYSIKCEGIEDDRKFNGEIKWKIKKKQEELDKKVKSFTDDWELVKSYF